MGVSLYDNMMGAGRRSSRIGTEAEDEFLRRSRAFDPRAAITETAGGLFDQFERGARRRIGDLRGSMVGAGRLGGGYGELDEAAAEYDLGADLNSKLAGLSLQGEQLNLANTQGLGAFGERQTGQALDLYSAERDRQLAEQEAKRNRKSSLFGSVLGLAGTLGGAFLGGPGGAAVGGKVGGWLGKKAGGG